MYSMHFQSTDKARKREPQRTYFLLYRSFHDQMWWYLATVKGVGEENTTMHGLKYIDVRQ